MPMYQNPPHSASTDLVQQDWLLLVNIKSNIKPSVEKKRTLLCLQFLCKNKYIFTLEMADGEIWPWGYLRLLSWCETWCYHGNKCTGMQARAKKSVLHVNPQGGNLSHAHKSCGCSEVDGSLPVWHFIRIGKRFLRRSGSNSDALWRRYWREWTHTHTLMLIPSNRQDNLQRLYWEIHIFPILFTNHVCGKKK